MKLLGFEIWHDCPNQCGFCALGDLKKITTPQQKIENINKLKSILESIDISNYNELALVGGELIYNIPLEVKNKLLSLIDYLISNYILSNKIDKLYIMTSLMNKNNIISDVIDKFKNKNVLGKLSINTSYDTKWRFNNITKNIWEENIGYIKKQGVNIHIEMILTNDVIDKFMNDDEELLRVMGNYNIDFIRPTTANNKTSLDMPENFFPKRKNFLTFLIKLQQKNKSLFDRILDMKMRASTIYILPYDKIIVRDNEHNVEDINNTILPCGHSGVFKCYSDSDKCIICDIDVFKNKI